MSHLLRHLVLTSKNPHLLVRKKKVSDIRILLWIEFMLTLMTWTAIEKKKESYILEQTVEAGLCSHMHNRGCCFFTIALT